MDNEIKSLFDKITLFRKRKVECEDDSKVEAPDFEINESVVEQFDVSSMQRTQITNTMSSAMPTNRKLDDLMNRRNIFTKASQND